MWKVSTETQATGRGVSCTAVPKAAVFAPVTERFQGLERGLSGYEHWLLYQGPGFKAHHHGS